MGYVFGGILIPKSRGHGSASPSFATTSQALLLTVCARCHSYVQLCDPMDCVLPGSSLHGVFQARILEWVATFHSRGSS